MQVNDEGKITAARDLVEPPFKSGAAALQVFLLFWLLSGRTHLLNIAVICRPAYTMFAQLQQTFASGMLHCTIRRTEPSSMAEQHPPDTHGGPEVSKAGPPWLAACLCTRKQPLT